MVFARWCAVLVVLALPAAAERPRLVVLDLTGSNVDPQALAAATDRIVATLAQREVFELISSQEIRTLLGVERQRQLVGCTESSCMSELSGAIGARFVLGGALVKLGDSYQLTLSGLDTQRSQPVGRAVRLSSSIEGVLSDLPFAVAQATGLPPPPEPSRALPVVLLGAGAAVFVAGGVVGFLGLTQEAALGGELNSSSLGTLDDYRRRSEQPALLKSVALGSMIGGAALLTLGIVLWPKGLGGSGVVVVPQTQGVAFAGALP